MKIIFLVFALVFVATEAFPNRRESTKVQKLATALKQSREVHPQTPEYDEVFNTFDVSISAIDDIMLSLHDQGVSYLAMSENGKAIQAEFSGIVWINLDAIEDNLLHILYTLNQAETFEEVVRMSKESWDYAKLRWNFQNRLVTRLVENEAPELFSQFEKLVLRKKTAWDNALVPIDTVLAKYLPEN